MKIEHKKISNTETLFYFPTSLPILGTFYADSAILPQHQLLETIFRSTLAKSLLLTSDFIYINSLTPENTEDLELITLAEIDEYITSSPCQQTADENNTELKIKLLLKTVIAPFLQRDGGDIELISYNAGIANVHFLGKCQGCPYAKQTLKNHVEKNLIHYIPQIREVVLA